MAVPKKKTSKSKRNMRRNANSKVPSTTLSEDSTSGEMKRPHHVSPDGNYRGRQVTAQKVNR